MTERRIGINLLGSLAAFGCLAFVLLTVMMAGGFGYLQVAWHLAVGFVYFLQENLPEISADAGTWGPGLAAFLLALITGHVLARSWAGRRGKAWKPWDTFALGAVLPLLFAVSFLVPGTFLQLSMLGHSPWFAKERGERTHAVGKLKELGLPLMEAANDDDRFPDSLEALVERGLVQRPDLIQREQGRDVPLEPVIYLGNGLLLDSDPSLPLLISPRYSEGGVLLRMVLTVGYETLTIRDEELYVWIDKAMAAKKP
jgi:hypothetical protein